jgi:hypothetical protein
VYIKPLPRSGYQPIHLEEKIYLKKETDKRVEIRKGIDEENVEVKRAK